MEKWPSMPDTGLMSTPFWRAMVAKVWRRSWNLSDNLLASNCKKPKTSPWDCYLTASGHYLFLVSCCVMARYATVWQQRVISGNLRRIIDAIVMQLWYNLGIPEEVEKDDPNSCCRR